MKKIILTIFLLFTIYNTSTFAMKNSCEANYINTYDIADCLIKSSNIKESYRYIKQLIASEDFPEAMFLLDKIKDKDDIYYTLKVNVLYEIGNFDEALQLHEKFLKFSENEDIVAKHIMLLAMKQKNTKAKLKLNYIKNTNTFYYLSGFINMQEGNIYSAIDNFKQVNSNSKYFENSQYYLAELCYTINDYQCTSKILKRSNSFYSKNKLAFLKENMLKTNIYLSIGEQYDSNVTDINETNTGISEQDSFRTYLVANIDVTYNFLNNFSIFGKSKNFMTFNHSVSEYNTREHSLEIGIMKKINNIDILLPSLSLDTVYIDEKHYLDSFKTNTSFAINFDKFRLSIPFSYEKKNFQNSIDKARDSKVFGLQPKLSFFLSKNNLLELSIGYYDEDADNKFYDNKGEIVEALYSQALTDKLSVATSLTYEHYDYKENRNDNHLEITGIISYTILKNTSLSFDFTYIDHNSNNKVNEYDKYIVGSSINYAF